MIIKRFRQPAKNQEIILAAFQEEDWPGRIDNPLPGREPDAQDRLHNAVRRLNQQNPRVLRFHSDGTGEGILWSALA